MIPWLAQTGGEELALRAILNYGPFGIILVAVLTGHLYVPKHVDDLRATLAECRAELKEERMLRQKEQEFTRDTLVPALTQATDLNKRLGEELLRPRSRAPR